MKFLDHCKWTKISGWFKAAHYELYGHLVFRIEQGEPVGFLNLGTKEPSFEIDSLTCDKLRALIQSDYLDHRAHYYLINTCDLTKQLSFDYDLYTLLEPLTLGLIKVGDLKIDIFED